MNSITFECEVITPMFLAGADGTTPELRAPSIKGALRFWWRALNGHLVTNQNGEFDYTQLKKEEGRIFGDTNEISSIVIMPCIIQSTEPVKISNTPHHNSSYCNKNNSNCNYGNKNYCSKATKRDARLYDFRLDLKFNSDRISEKAIKFLITNTFLLGGLGKRSRRGFGSIIIKDCPIFSSKEKLEKYLSKIPMITEDKGYPHIKNIELGKKYDTYEDVLIAIGEASHINKHNSLGHTNKRFASPIYTSVVKLNTNEYYLIITTLCTADEISYNSPTSKQTGFINSLK